MNIRKIMNRENVKRIIGVILCIIVTLISIFGLAKTATTPERYKNTIQSIDDKKTAVTGLTAAMVAASTALASVPGETTTPIANQIMEMSSYLFVVVCVLVLEKSLLTVMGYLSFYVLIPIACVLIALYFLFKKDFFMMLGIKITVFAIVIVGIIPLSQKISDLIYTVNQSTIEQATENVEETITVEEPEEDKSWLDSVVDKVKGGVSDIGKQAKEMLNKFIDAVAIFIITYCVIPIIVVFLVIWLINLLFKINIKLPSTSKIKQMSGGQRKKNLIDME